jgi:hypothetical protein
VEAQFRKYYANVEPVTGMTSALTIKFFQDYNDSTVSLTRMIYQAPFQSRVDFGIPARALSIETSNVSATDPFLYYGFVLESRKQRDV